MTVASHTCICRIGCTYNYKYINMQTLQEEKDASHSNTCTKGQSRVEGGGYMYMYMYMYTNYMVLYVIALTIHWVRYSVGTQHSLLCILRVCTSLSHNYTYHQQSVRVQASPLLWGWLGQLSLVGWWGRGEWGSMCCGSCRQGFSWQYSLRHGLQCYAMQYTHWHTHSAALVLHTFQDIRSLVLGICIQLLLNRRGT